VGHYLRESNPRMAEALRTFGRWITRFTTPITLFEGFYDLTIMAECSIDCYKDSCK
jgi:hypothetical protein